MTDKKRESPEGEEPNEKESYEVGYGKPPAHARFSKGVSGNPSGRKTGSKNLVTKICLELDKKIAVSVKGKRKMLPKSDVIISQLVNNAAGGDIRSTLTIMQAIQKYEADARGAQVGLAASETVEEADLFVVEDFVRRAKKGGLSDE